MILKQKRITNVYNTFTPLPDTVVQVHITGLCQIARGILQLMILEQKRNGELHVIDARISISTSF